MRPGSTEEIHIKFSSKRKHLMSKHSSKFQNINIFSARWSALENGIKLYPIYINRLKDKSCMCISGLKKIVCIRPLTTDTDKVFGLIIVLVILFHRCFFAVFQKNKLELLSTTPHQTFDFDLDL